MDGPAPGYVTLLVEATIDPGVTIGRHTHPGIESAYVLEGGFELPYKVSRPAPSCQVTAFKYRPKRPMQVVSLAIQRREFLSLTSWRKESHWRLQFSGSADGCEAGRNYFYTADTIKPCDVAPADGAGWPVRRLSRYVRSRVRTDETVAVRHLHPRQRGGVEDSAFGDDLV
jgi:hypothetical protein